MRFSRLQRRLIILERFLRDAGFYQSSDGGRYLIDGKVYFRATLERWIQSGVERGDSQFDQFKRDISEHFSGIAASQLTDERNAGTFAFADAIGINRDKARYAIDSFHHRTRPTFGLFVMNGDDAQRFVHQYGGLYYLYRLERNETTKRIFDTDDPVVVRCGLSVRYPVPYVKSVYNQDHFHIRAKIAIPNYYMRSPKKNLISRCNLNMMESCALLTAMAVFFGVSKNAENLREMTYQIRSTSILRVCPGCLRTRVKDLPGGS